MFVRLQLCLCACPWCDTKHTWEKLDKDKISFDEMLAKTKDAPTWADVSEDDLVDYLSVQPEELIVITGGEPCNYDLVNFTSQLIDCGKIVQIETSGTAEIKVDYATFVTVSPKLNMPGGLPFIDDSLARANEIKMPVGKMADVALLKALLDRDDIKAKVYLQPLSQSEKATELCIEQARLNGWRLSAQLHRYLKIR